MILQKNIPKAKRPQPVPPIPMAPLTQQTAKKTRASIGSHAVKLYIILMDTEADHTGVIRIERADLAKRMGVGITTIASQLQSYAGMGFCRG